MNKTRILLISFVCLIFPSVAAADIPGAFREFVTHGNFNEIANAFERTALIFSDSGFDHFVTVFFLGAVIVWLAVAVIGCRMFSVVPQAVLMQGTVFIMAGALIYMALIDPKTDISVYDPVTNQHMIIADVPEGVALIAGAQNTIDEAIVDMIWTSSDPESYLANAGGDIFNILAHAFDSKRFIPSVDDSYGQLLTKSIQKYWMDCSVYAIEGPTGGFDLNVLHDGSMTLIDVLALLKNEAQYTTTYLNGNMSGMRATCTEAYGYIEDDLNGLTETGTGQKFWEERCGAAGYYDQDSATGTAAVTVCKNKTIDFLAAQVPSISDSMSLVRQYIVANALQGYIKKSDVASLSNYKIMTAARGEAVSALNWVPIIKGVVFAVYLGLIPFLLMLLPTMLFPKIVQFILGIFVFMICWDVCDAILHSYAMDKSLAMMRDIFDGASNLSLLDIWLMSNESMKSLVLFGKMRWTSMMLAAVVSAVIARYGGVALAHFAGQMNFSGLSSQAANEIYDPESRASDLRELPVAMPTEAVSNEYGAMAISRDWAMKKRAELSSTNKIIENAGGGDVAVNQMADIRTTMHREGVGHVNAVNNVEEETLFRAEDQAYARSHAGAIRGLGEDLAVSDWGATSYQQNTRLQSDIQNMHAFKTDMVHEVANLGYLKETVGSMFRNRIVDDWGTVNTSLLTAFNSTGPVTVSLTSAEQKANIASFINAAKGTDLTAGEIPDSLRMSMALDKNAENLTVPFFEGVEGINTTSYHNNHMDVYGHGVSYQSNALLEALGNDTFVGSDIDVVGHKDAVIAEYARAVSTYHGEIQRDLLGYRTNVGVGSSTSHGGSRHGDLLVGGEMSKVNAINENQVSTQLRELLTDVSSNLEAQRLIQEDFNNRLHYNERSFDIPSMQDVEEIPDKVERFLEELGGNN